MLNNVHIKIQEKLQRVPFHWPPSQRIQAELWFASELNDFQEHISSSPEDESAFWVKMPEDLLHYCATKKAQQYVWHQFRKALSYAEPLLYKAGYRWLLEHKDLATPTKRSIFQWAQQQYSLNTLLSAVCELPSKTSVDYITHWVQHLQNVNVKPASLLTRLKQIEECEDLRNESSINEEYWVNVLLPALPYLSSDTLNSFKPPYLPCIFDTDDPALMNILFNAVPEKCQSWVISNMLDFSDFYNASGENIEDVTRHLYPYVDSISDQRIHQYLVWDLSHRNDDIKNVITILDKYMPSLATALDGLGIMSIEHIHNTLLQKWILPEPLDALLLPLHFDDDCMLI